MNKFVSGVTKSPKDKRDLNVKLFLSAEKLPAEISYRSMMTAIRNQGQEGACTGFAATYLKEYQEKMDYGQFIALSPRFAYEESKRISGSKEGSTMKATAQALINKGICEDSYWPYMPLGTYPAKVGAYQNAERFKVQAKYTRITKESQLKAALVQYGPILTGVTVSKNWYRQKNGHIPNPTFMEKMQGVLGGHAITVVGYSDKTQEYCFINSWGADWGDKGFGYITYAHMKSILMDAYALIDISDPLPYKLNMTIGVSEEEHFPLPLIVKFLDGRMWELVENFEYHRECGEIIAIPARFKFDFASIPQFLWGWIGSPTGEYGPGALVHDFLCEQKDYPISKADSIFLEAMEVLGVSIWKRYIMYFACRIFHGFKK
jgi:hypothetical protein